MRIEIGALALALSVAACSGRAPVAEPTASTASPIQGGVTDTTHEFVVAVIQELQQGQQSGLALCSGSLLAPNLVATARHCVAAVTSDQVDCNVTTFGTVASPSALAVTTDPNISTANPHYYAVEKIVVPPATSFCGNDLALLILSTSVALPEYVTPVIDPPMTDHSVWSTTITAIGYGVDSPDDTAGGTAGVRRIRQDIDLACIPHDKTIADCLSDPAASQFLSANEFEASGGTCDGDSGSGAFEQRNFNAGKWVSFGVLSRGATDADSDTCVSALYTRFDAWGSLLTSTAVEAAQLGGYATPAWAVAAGAEAGIVPADAAPPGTEAGQGGGGAECLAVSEACFADTDCCSVNCISHDNGTTYLCASCNNDNPCDVGYQCDQGTCILAGASMNTNTHAAAGAGGAEGGAAASPTSHPSGQGCSAAAGVGSAPGSALLDVAACLALGGFLRRRLTQRVLRMQGGRRNRTPGNHGAINHV
jgi:V8-like Glu-specific endopeptidase